MYLKMWATMIKMEAKVVDPLLVSMKDTWNKESGFAYPSLSKIYLAVWLIFLEESLIGPFCKLRKQ